jgi:hypothetical protein
MRTIVPIRHQDQIVPHPGFKTRRFDSDTHVKIVPIGHSGSDVCNLTLRTMWFQGGTQY